MKGKSAFSALEAREIRELLQQKAGSDRNEQKRLRKRMRKLGFYITDFSDSYDGFLVHDFEALVARGTITIDS